MTLIQLIFYLTLLTKRANPIEYDTITQITNTFREAYGCRPVSEDDNLTRAAQARADEILKAGILVTMEFGKLLSQFIDIEPPARI